MPTERLTFTGASGAELSARLEMPISGEPVAYALFAHCFTCSKNLKPVVTISRALAMQGIGVLRFDFTGLGESEGDFTDTNFSSNIADLVAAAEFLEAEYAAPRILIGHSLGGAAVLQAAVDVPASVAVATIGAPYDPSHVEKLLESSRAEIEERGEADVTIAGRTFTIQKQFLEDLGASRMRDLIGELDRALLVFHSPVDNIVGIENAERIYKAAKHPKSFVSLDEADHLLSDEADSAYVGAVIAAWARKYLGVPRIAEQVDVDVDRVVARIGDEGFRTDIAARGHPLTADEPRSAGGTDTGPSPYDLVVAGLGACTAMTMRMYADRKEWPLDEAVVRLRHQKIHAADCEECEGEPDARIDHVEREIELYGELDEEQRAKLIDIAERCPVHRTLDSAVHVTTSVRD